MGATAVGTTVASKTIENDDDVDLSDVGEGPGGGVPSFAFNSFGTGPALTTLRGGSNHFRCRVTSGTGAPAIADNNVVITPSRTPRKVFLAVFGTNTPKFHAEISGATVLIGSKVAPAVSTAYDFELIVLF